MEPLKTQYKNRRKLLGLGVIAVTLSFFWNYFSHKFNSDREKTEVFLTADGKLVEIPVSKIKDRSKKVNKMGIFKWMQRYKKSKT